MRIWRLLILLKARHHGDLTFSSRAQGCVLRLQDGDDVVACLCAGVTCESHAALIAGDEITHGGARLPTHPG